MQSVIDSDVLDVLRTALGDELPALIDELLRELPKGIQELHRLSGAGEGEALARLAHTLRGGCANLGATMLASGFTALERAALADERAQWERLIEHIEQVFHKTQAQLQAHGGPS